MLWSRKPQRLTCSTCGTEQILAHFRAWDGQGVCLVEAPTCPRGGCPGNMAEQHSLAIERMSIQQRRDEARLTGCEKEWLHQCGIEVWK